MVFVDTITCGVTTARAALRGARDGTHERRAPRERGRVPARGSASWVALVSMVSRSPQDEASARSAKVTRPPWPRSQFYNETVASA